MSGTPIHIAWQNLRRRCRPALQARYPTYAGVKYDERWETFEGFLANQPLGRPFEPGLSLSRIGDVGDYTPENTRWVTRSENTRELNERTMTKMSDGRFASDVARDNGISANVMRTRLSRGWTPDDAASVPPKRGADSGRAGREGRMLRLPDGRFAADVARSNGVARGTWHARYARGMSIEQAVARSPHRSVNP